MEPLLHKEFFQMLQQARKSTSLESAMIQIRNDVLDLYLLTLEQVQNLDSVWKILLIQSWNQCAC